MRVGPQTGPQEVTMPHSLLFCKRSFLAICLFLFSGAFCLAQITNVTDMTSTPLPGTGHDYFKMLSETVNPANGSLSIRIGVPVPPGRGLTLPFSFAYDSNGAYGSVIGITGEGTYLNNPMFLSQYGWSYTVPQLSIQQVELMNGQWQCPAYIDYVFQDPLGARHALDLASTYVSTGKCGYSSETPGGDDAVVAALGCSQSGICGSAVVADADGTAYYFGQVVAHESNPGPMYSSMPTWVEDRNGNRVAFTDNNNGAFTVADTLGRTVLSSSGFGASGNTLTVSGLSSPYTVNWTTASYNFNPNASLAWGDGYCRGMSNAQGTSVPVVSSITLPNQQSYSFSYDSNYGLINQITYPTGAKVTYTWGHNSQSEIANFADSNGSNNGCQYTFDTPAITDRYVYFDGSTLALHQHFTYSTTWSGTSWTSKTTTVTTTDVLRGLSFTTTYTYASVPARQQYYDYNLFATQIPVEQQVVYTDWGGATTLRTVNEYWQDMFQKLCESATETVGSSNLTSRTDYVYSTQGLQLTDKKEWDWGTQSACPASGYSPPSGTPLRETGHLLCVSRRYPLVHGRPVYI